MKTMKSLLSKKAPCFFRLYAKAKALVRTSILCIFLTLTLSLSAENLRIPLRLQSSLFPLQLRLFETSEKTSLPPNYLKEIYALLLKDLEQGGRFNLDHPHSKTRLHLRLREQKLLCSLYRNNTKSFLKEHLLSGNFAEDSRLIHQISDELHKKLTGHEGIASCRILYSLTKGEKSDIWESDIDGFHARQLTNSEHYTFAPSYFPSQSLYLFLSYQDSQSKIFLAPLDGSNARAFIPLSGNQIFPSVSKDTKSIVFISDLLGNPDLFIQAIKPSLNGFFQVQGPAKQLFQAPQATQSSPSFSPDGKQIVFVSNFEGAPRIYILRPGQKAQLISKRSSYCTSPSWSPDGSKIAYSARFKGLRQIWIYDCKTKMERPLTEGGGHKDNPSWAPDSFHLLFHQEEDKTAALYLCHLGSTQIYKIPTPKGKARFPSCAKGRHKS